MCVGLIVGEDSNDHHHPIFAILMFSVSPSMYPPIVESPSMSLPIVEWEYEWNESLLRKSHG